MPDTSQGTRLSDKAPWETYADEMTEKISPDLAAEIDEYAKHRYDPEQTSNQNKEELARQREYSQQVGKDYQWVTPEEYEDEAQRVGRVIHSSVFISKLRGLGINCWYVQHPQAQKAVLMIQVGNKEPEVACWVQQGFMQELSSMRFDDKGVPLDERRRGWRTCLLQLLLKEYLTETAANTIFGYPRQTKAYERYNATLYEFRKRAHQII